MRHRLIPCVTLAALVGMPAATLAQQATGVRNRVTDPASSASTVRSNQSTTLEGRKNGIGDLAGESGRNATPGSEVLGSERSRNGDEAGRNAGGLDVGAESSRNHQGGSGTNREQAKNGDSRDESAKNGSNNRGDDNRSSNEQQKNSAARNDSGSSNKDERDNHDENNSSGNDNKDQDERDKNDAGSGENRNANSRSGPDDSSSNEGTRSNKVITAIRGRGRTTPTERVGGAGLTRVAPGISPRIPTPVQYDPTAGDDAGHMDPNQPAGRPAAGQPPPGARPGRGAFDKGQITGKGLGQPDSATKAEGAPRN